VVLGAFVIGMIQQVVGGYIFQSYAPALPFIIMFLVLAVRPQGLVAIRTQRL
jgi:branched-subunit amino acid ABC-type transport system permease component